MKDFDWKKFLASDEQTQRTIIAEIKTLKPWRHKMICRTCSKCGGIIPQEVNGYVPDSAMPPCSAPDPVTEDFRILAWELRDKVDKLLYHYSLLEIFASRENRTLWDERRFLEQTTPPEMICAALMSWPVKEVEK